MATYVPTSGGTEYYSYGPDNMRVWKPPSGPEEVYFYGAQGEKLGRFNYGTGVFTTLRRSIYFGARVVNEGQDRLGSVPDHGGYYPYGEAQTAGFNDQDRFATYYRDGTSLLDYARNRYYSSTLGRFMSADPYVNRAGLGDPGSWNRYTYVGNDPVNFNDTQGLFACAINGIPCDFYSSWILLAYPFMFQRQMPAPADPPAPTAAADRAMLRKRIRALP